MDESRRAPETTPQVFTLPWLADQQILLVMQAHTAILLKPDMGVHVSAVYHLTPSATSIFFALLQAYPHYCEYSTLLSTLYPTEETSLSSFQHLNIRPVRNALYILTPVLQALETEAVVLRKRGYLLAPARSPHAENNRSVKKSK